MRLKPPKWSPETAKRCTGHAASWRHLTIPDLVTVLQEAQADGKSPAEAAMVACATWQAEPTDLLLCAVLERAHEQWTDGELLALVETHLAPLLPMASTDWLTSAHRDIVRVRHLARGELRTVAWETLRATTTVFVDGAEVEVPDNKTRWAACKELHRQYAGWTSKGMAAETQDELERLEKTGGPDLPERATH